MSNVERMTKLRGPNDDIECQRFAFGIRISDLTRHLEFVIRHSHLSASIGLTLAALRAGSQQASRATETSSSGTAANVSGSVGPLPKSRPRRSCDYPSAPITPIAVPVLPSLGPFRHPRAST